VAHWTTGWQLLYLLYYFRKQDQDSWTGSSSGGDKDSKPLLRILGPGPDGKGVTCQCSRLTCAGFYACELIEPKIIDITRHGLDPGSLQTLVQAQVESRLSEADSVAKHALMYAPFENFFATIVDDCL
jgi:hypothetical protein